MGNNEIEKEILQMKMKNSNIKSREQRESSLKRETY